MSLIDYDSLKRELKRNAMLALIERSAVPVVRCGDCIWYDKSTASGTYEPVAYKCKLHQRFTLGNMFCSEGARKDDEII